MFKNLFSFDTDEIFSLYYSHKKKKKERKKRLIMFIPCGFIKWQTMSDLKRWTLAQVPGQF